MAKMDPCVWVDSSQLRTTVGSHLFQTEPQAAWPAHASSLYHAVWRLEHVRPASAAPPGWGGAGQEPSLVFWGCLSRPTVWGRRLCASLGSIARPDRPPQASKPGPWEHGCQQGWSRRPPVLSVLPIRHPQEAGVFVASWRQGTG